MFTPSLVEVAVSVFLQSTVLILVGLLAARTCGSLRPAVQSAILRAMLQKSQPSHWRGQSSA